MVRLHPVCHCNIDTVTLAGRSPMSYSALDTDVTCTTTWRLVGRLPGEPELQRIRIPSAGATVGRSSRVADIVLPSAFVSSRHARLVPTDLGVEISDSGSRNGTFVRRERIEGSEIAEAGDTVAFADIEFQLQADPLNRPVDQQLGGTNVLGSNALETEWTISNFSELLEKKLVRIVMQPIVELRTGRLIGLASQARSDVRGLETSAKMFDAAEQLNKVATLSAICREKAVDTARGALKGKRLFLDTHAHEDFTRDVLRSMDVIRRKLPLTNLVLKVPEDRLDEVAATRTFVRKLAQMRVELSLSEFGAGNSRINEVLRLRPDFVSFHHSLTSDIDHSTPQAQDAVKSIVTMLNSLSIRCVADGIERNEEADVCRRLGFDSAQGFLFGRPAGIDALCMTEHAITGVAAAHHQRRHTQEFDAVQDDE